MLTPSINIINSIDLIRHISEHGHIRWSGVNKPPESPGVVMYIIDVKLASSEDAKFVAVANNCLALDSWTIACDARFIANVRMLAFARSLLTASAVTAGLRVMTLRERHRFHLYNSWSLIVKIEAMVREPRRLEYLSGSFARLGIKLIELPISEQGGGIHAYVESLSKQARVRMTPRGEILEVVALSESIEREYLQFTILHELAHIVLGHVKQGTVEKYIGYRNEVEADRFAINLSETPKVRFLSWFVPFLMLDLVMLDAWSCVWAVLGEHATIADVEQATPADLERVVGRFHLHNCYYGHPLQISRFLQYEDLPGYGDFDYSYVKEYRKLSSYIEDACKEEDEARSLMHMKWILEELLRLSLSG
jgi:hypothetical protein